MVVKSSFVHRLVDSGSWSDGIWSTIIAYFVVLTFLLMWYEIEDTATTRLRPRSIFSLSCKTRVNIFTFFI